MSGDSASLLRTIRNIASGVETTLKRA